MLVWALLCIIRPNPLGDAAHQRLPAPAETKTRASCICWVPHLMRTFPGSSSSMHLQVAAFMALLGSQAETSREPPAGADGQAPAAEAGVQLQAALEAAERERDTARQQLAKWVLAGP